MRGSQLDIVGLFPSFDSRSFGGVQASGRAAWEGIVGRIGEQRARALCYEAGTSKAKAVLRAIGNRGKANVVLVWHLHMLKLLPLFDQSASRVILFLHGIEAWRKHDSFTQFLFTRVNLVLSNSEHTWTRFLHCNPAFQNMSHRTVHLGTGTSLGGTTPFPSDPPAVLMVGRLDTREDYKGHRQMIEAWPQVLERRPDAQLWIAGSGDLRPTLEDLARRQTLGDSVRFYGQISDADKEQLMARCRCLAMPSRGEGFGLVYLEAMRMGRPCLVSNVDAGLEVVNPPEAGLAVNPDDRPALVAAINRLLAPGPEWDQWSARARARYESRFTGEHFRQRLLTALFQT